MRTESLAEFVVLAKHLNFRKAASELSMTQSNLSKHIIGLEREVGFSLFERGPVVGLTSAGMRFLEYAQQVLGILDVAVPTCRRISKQAPAVRLQHFSQNDTVAPIVHEAKRRGIPVSFLDVEASLLTVFTDGLVDVALFYDLEGTEAAGALADIGVESFVVGTDALAIVAMLDGGPFGEKPLTRGDLRGTSVVVPRSAYYNETSCAFDKLFGDDLGLRFVPRADLVGSALKYEDLRDGLFISSVSLVKALFGARDDVIVYDTLDGAPIVSAKRMYFRADNPNARDFVELARSLEGVSPL